MGYSRVTHSLGSYNNFNPDNTDTEIYISSETGLSEILEMCKEKWGEINFCDITISAEHIHTQCLGYDRYDSSDYTDFIKITLTKKN